MKCSYTNECQNRSNNMKEYSVDEDDVKKYTSYFYPHRNLFCVCFIYCCYMVPCVIYSNIYIPLHLNNGTSLL